MIEAALRTAAIVLLLLEKVLVLHLHSRVATGWDDLAVVADQVRVELQLACAALVVAARRAHLHVHVHVIAVAGANVTTD